MRIKRGKDNLIKPLRPFVADVHLKGVQRGQEANLLFESTDDHDSMFTIVEMLYVRLYMTIRTNLWADK